MKSLIFAKRNLKEIIRDPLSATFCLIFPLALLFLLEIIVAGIGVDALSATPQFSITNLTPSIAVFSFSFLTLFGSMLISKDRATSFQSRLNVSPMKSKDFILGYSFPLFVLAFLQVIISFLACFIFGLQLSFYLLLSIVFLIPPAILFIGLGLLIGALFNSNSASGVSSIIINLGAIMGGMFFPIQNMSGAFVVVANVFPFYPALQVVRGVMVGDFSNILVSLLTIFAYIIVIFAVAIFLFYKKMKSDKK